jgi:galactokinase/mevalonate kinase-like predicted kinase
MTALGAADAKIRDLRTVIANMRAKYGDGYARLEQTVALLQKEVVRLTGENERLRHENAKLEKKAKSAEKIPALKAVAAELKAALLKKQKELEKALDAAGVMRNRLRKDFATSDTPQGTSIFKKPVSTKEKSGRKSGGQLGHEGHTLRPFPNPTEIINKMPPNEFCDCGGKIEIRKGKSKQLVDLKTIVTVTEEIVRVGYCDRCGKKHEGVFSEKFVNPVNYGDNIKSLVSLLNTHMNLPAGKITELFDILTNSAVRMSDGTVVNIIDAFAEKSTGTIENIKNRLIESGLMHVDETGCRVDGHLDWMQIFANKYFTLFSHNKKRGDLVFENEDILLLFTGILMHDHFKSYYRYSHITHAECNDHIDRRVKAVAEILKHAWAAEFRSFLNKTWERKKKLIAEDGTFTKDEIKDVFTEYASIIANGVAEYEAAIAGKKCIKYYNEEKCLLNRLKEYTAEHLRFVTDTIVPCGNNLAEQCAKEAKRKMKVAGCYRSDKGADNYARSASIISTLKKQKMNVFDGITDIFAGKTLKFGNSP